MSISKHPTEISLSVIGDDKLKQYIRDCIIYHVNQLVSVCNGWYGPVIDKTMFYFTGIHPYREVYVRSVINDLRQELSNGFKIRLTKRAGFDAMLTVTITRKISDSTIYFS